MEQRQIEFTSNGPKRIICRRNTVKDKPTKSVKRIVRRRYSTTHDHLAVLRTYPLGNVSKKNIPFRAIGRMNLTRQTYTLNPADRNEPLHIVSNAETVSNENEHDCQSQLVVDGQNELLSIGSDVDVVNENEGDRQSQPVLKSQNEVSLIDFDAPPLPKEIDDGNVQKFESWVDILLSHHDDSPSMPVLIPQSLEKPKTFEPDPPLAKEPKVKKPIPQLLPIRQPSEKCIDIVLRHANADKRKVETPNDDTFNPWLIDFNNTTVSINFDYNDGQFGSLHSTG